MITSSFYTDNLYRGYPFKTSPDEDPAVAPILRALVGLKVMVYAGSPFVNNFPRVFLIEWSTLRDRYLLTFQVRDKEGVSINNQIIIPKDTAIGARLSVKDTANEVTIAVVVGDVSDITGNWFNLNLQFEPTCLLWYLHRGVSTINVMNQERHRVQLDPEVIDEGYRNIYNKVSWWLQPCSSLETISSGQPCLFAGGFNCELRQLQQNRRLQFNPNEGAGIGVVDTDIPLGFISTSTSNVCERPPVSTLRRDGLPSHLDVIYFFCDAAGPDIVMTGDTSVLIRAEPDISTIFISVATLFGESC
jgi:hypothetical protein